MLLVPLLEQSRRSGAPEEFAPDLIGSESKELDDKLVALVVLGARMGGTGCRKNSQPGAQR